MAARVEGEYFLETTQTTYAEGYLSNDSARKATAARAEDTGPEVDFENSHTAAWGAIVEKSFASMITSGPLAPPCLLMAVVQTYSRYTCIVSPI